MSGLLTEKAEINKTQPCVNWPYSSLTSGMPEGIEAGILNTCNLVISALKAKMIYWSLHHALLFSTMIQNRGCLVHNSDMQTSSVPSICSVAKNTEHIMFSTLKAMTEDYSTGWAGKKGRKLSVACICRAFQLYALGCKCCLIYLTYLECRSASLSPCCSLLLLPLFFSWILP